MQWQPIEMAPKDGSQVLVWREGWDICLLIWKTNHRIVEARKVGEDVFGMSDSYFGDPIESDDYELAKPGQGPTHWLPLPPVPVENEKAA